MGETNRLREIYEEVASGLPLRIPVSTYRLQFSRDFTFAGAKDIIGYLNKLGISDIYASPFFKAQPGSLHGYDIVDHNSLSPEVGAREDFEAMSAELRSNDMGHISDIVPNHMSITGSGNTWWLDVLENGRCSPYSQFFDIDWRPLKEELEDRVILPILGGLYGDILEEQQIRLLFDGGALVIEYWEHRMPIDPSTYDAVLTYRQDDLRGTLGLENADYQEYLSIVTSLKNLPSRQEEDPAKIAERLREKEIAKKRLLYLYESSPEFRGFLDENIGIFNGQKGDPESFDLLDGLLSAQVYRLSFWRVATEEINYRRFFDINDLGAIRMEDERVFAECHRLVLELIGWGHVSGLRVDHPDGLHNPPEYFRRLQEGCFAALCMSRHDDGENGKRYREIYREGLKASPEGPLKRPLFVIGEKILMESEKLSHEWPIFGTTGYGFMNAVNAVLIDSGSAKNTDRIYRRFSKQTAKFPELFHNKKKLIMETSMASEINVLGHSLNRISERDRHYRDFTLNNLVDAIAEVIAFFPVYRTYISPTGISETDRQYIETAITKARRWNRDINPLVFDFIRDVLLLNYPITEDPALKHECLDFTMKFQQLTGPVMAKGIEDTAFYTYNRLVSLNEVGGNPERLGMTVDAFHGQNFERQKNWPHTLLATSTHDAKRSEDVRARINVITELSDEWKESIIRWARTNRKFKRNLEGQPVPSRNEEYLLYQTLIGAWPMHVTDESSFADFAERIKQYMVKAVREAKSNSSWLNPNLEYEEALTQFIDKCLGHDPFLEGLRSFAAKATHYGMFNSLSQTLLKITSPGVPDFYQGTELWTLSLVDPDNRTPVDYALRSKLLDEIISMESSLQKAELAEELLKTKEDGRLKLYLTYKSLNFRRDHRKLYGEGSYMPLEVVGKHSERLIAFARHDNGATAITVAPRLISSLVGSNEAPLGDIWEDTAMLLPDGIMSGEYINILTDASVSMEEANETKSLRVADVLRRFPVALLSSRL